MLVNSAATTVTLKVVVRVTSPSVYDTVTVLLPALAELSSLYVDEDVTFLVEPSLYVAVTTMPTVLRLSPIV